MQLPHAYTEATRLKVPACALHHRSVSETIQTFPNCTVPHTQK